MGKYIESCKGLPFGQLQLPYVLGDYSLLNRNKLPDDADKLVKHKKFSSHTHLLNDTNFNLVTVICLRSFRFQSLTIASVIII